MPSQTTPAAGALAGAALVQELTLPVIDRWELDPAQADALAPMFKALGDPVRLRLLSLIASAPDGEICVCDLTVGFQLSGPTISHHLKVLRQTGLVASDRRGTWVYYRLLPAARGALGTLLDAGTTFAAVA
jgi:ArsR family transcriptional regulator